MTKIIGISLVTFFMVLQAVGYFSIRDRESTFDELKAKDVSLILHQISNPEDLRYVKYYSIEKDYFLSNAITTETNFDLTEMKIEMINSFYYDSISKLETSEKTKESDEKIVSILDNMPTYLEAYKISILDAQRISKEQNTEFKMGKYSVDLEKKLCVKRKEITNLPENNFKTLLNTYLETKNEIYFQPFKKSMLSYLQRSKSEGKSLKMKCCGLSLLCVPLYLGFIEQI
jgi:hypothetical protein